MEREGEGRGGKEWGGCEKKEEKYHCVLSTTPVWGFELLMIIGVMGVGRGAAIDIQRINTSLGLLVRVSTSFRQKIDSVPSKISNSS